MNMKFNKFITMITEEVLAIVVAVVVVVVVVVVAVAVVAVLVVAVAVVVVVVAAVVVATQPAVTPFNNKENTPGKSITYRN
jgi:uncharacterized membrane protein